MAVDDEESPRKVSKLTGRWQDELNFLSSPFALEEVGFVEVWLER